jgi:hypothetical protein
MRAIRVARHYCLAERRLTPRQTSQNDGMSDEPKKRSRAWIWWAMITLIVLYPLSEGPAFWWASQEGAFSKRWQTMKTVYAPLECACNRAEWFGDAMRWYVRKFTDWRP